jgi:hypothetical protein
MIKTKSKLLKEYKTKLNSFVALPLYLMLGSLILLNQIFSVSLAGLIYFGLAIYLFWMKSFNFRDIQFRVLLIAVQVLTSLMLALSYLATL